MDNVPQKAFSEASWSVYFFWWWWLIMHYLCYFQLSVMPSNFSSVFIIHQCHSIAQVPVSDNPRSSSKTHGTVQHSERRFPRVLAHEDIIYRRDNIKALRVNSGLFTVSLTCIALRHRVLSGLHLKCLTAKIRSGSHWKGRLWFTLRSNWEW